MKKGFLLGIGGMMRRPFRSALRFSLPFVGICVLVASFQNCDGFRSAQVVGGLAENSLPQTESSSMAPGSTSSCSLVIASPVLTGANLPIFWETKGAGSVKITLGDSVLADNLSPSGEVLIRMPLYPARYTYKLTITDGSRTQTCIAPVAVMQSGMTHPFAQKWPQIYAEAGSYGVENPTSALIQGAIGELAGRGFHLHLMGGGFQTTLKDNSSAFVDAVISGRIQAACKNSRVDPSDTSDRTCNLSTSGRADLLASIQQHLDAEKNDLQNVAYWILDDSPGDIRSLIETIYDMIAEANKTSAVVRPTICGVGSDLDMLPLSGASTSTRYSYLNNALANYSAKACNVVALYSYGQHKMPYSSVGVDWSMQWLLPYTISVLKSKGWNPNSQPLLGMPQAFYYTQKQISGNNAYVSVNRGSVALQMSSYCAAGASGILFYSWHDSRGAEAGTHEPWNTADIRDGLTDGLAICQQIWKNGGIVPADTQRKLDLMRIQSGLEGYHLSYNTYNVVGAGWMGGGNGYVNAERVDYPLSIVHALADLKFLSSPSIVGPGKASDYLLYTCHAGQSYSLYATLDHPLASDISKAKNSCNGTGSNGATTIYGQNYAISEM